MSHEQKNKIRQAAKDLRQMGRKLGPTFDAVDLATETGNYFWTGLSDRQTRVALRYLSLV